MSVLSLDVKWCCSFWVVFATNADHTSGGRVMTESNLSDAMLRTRIEQPLGRRRVVCEVFDVGLGSQLERGRPQRGLVGRINHDHAHGVAVHDRAAQCVLDLLAVGLLPRHEVLDEPAT